MHTGQTGGVPKRTEALADGRFASLVQRETRSAGTSEKAGGKLQLAPDQQEAAEVCKLVQLSSGSRVYPERHDQLCLLRAGGHDEDRVHP